MNLQRHAAPDPTFHPNLVGLKSSDPDIFPLEFQLFASFWMRQCAKPARCEPAERRRCVLKRLGRSSSHTCRRCSCHLGLSFSLSQVWGIEMYKFHRGPAYAGGSHMAGPVVPTVPFWKSMAINATIAS